MFRHSRSLDLQVAPTADGSTERLPTPGRGIASHPTRAPGAAGLSPAELQPCRLLTITFLLELRREALQAFLREPGVRDRNPSGGEPLVLAVERRGKANIRAALVQKSVERRSLSGQRPARGRSPRCRHWQC